MKAITYSRYGSPEVLTLSEVPTPQPEEGQLLIRVRAAEATKSDCEMRSFRYPVKWFWLPLRIAMGITKPRRPILGFYFSGEVAAVGTGVTGFAVGDEVFGTSRFRLGAYAQYLAVPEHFPLAAKPSDMSFIEAAAVPLGGFNALHFMDLGRIEPGASVLIIGAGGSIGTHAVQIAKARGATVTVVDRGSKEAALRGFGADHFIDYERETFTRSDAQYDVIFDMVPDTDYRACQNRLKPGGRYLSGNPRVATMLRIFLTNRLGDTTASFAFAPETKQALEELKKMIEAGQIRSIVDRTFSMNQAARAHRQVETEQRVGAVVIEIDSR
jgi:NADPH:quinone reductase-like Zn-dependent oxidoreductase